jgi:hypothetical protein
MNIDKTIPVITIRQPWASSIIHGGKDIENRTWITKYRGPIYIQSSASIRMAEMVGWQNFVRERKIKFPMSFLHEDVEDFPTGGILGIADLVDCVSSHTSPWFEGPYGFVLKNPRPVPFYPLKGALGIFRIK